MKLRDSRFEPLRIRTAVPLSRPLTNSGSRSTRPASVHAEGRRPAGIVSAYYIGRISRKQAYAVLLHMYTAMYGGRMLNAAPLPVLPMVIACVCAPAAAIATE